MKRDDTAGPSLHDPERHPDETLEQYRARQRRSKEAARWRVTKDTVYFTHSPIRGPSRRDQHREKVAESKVQVGPKFERERKRKQHEHKQRDQNGAFTLVGRNPFKPRRVWLAGISAQRGY